MLRTVLRTPAHSALVVLTLGLGIGTATAIFSVVNGVLLQPLPFPDQERLMILWQRAVGVGVQEDWFSPAQYFDLREQVGSFEEVAIVGGANRTLTDDDEHPERVGVLTASSSLFDVLGIVPSAGRRLHAADDQPGAERVVLLSHDLAARRFGDAATPSDGVAGGAALGDIVGRTLVLDGVPHPVIGVLPPGLVLDAELLPTLQTVPVFDLVMSMPLEDPGVTTRGSENFNVVAKLDRNTTPARLEAELLSIAAEFGRDPGSLAAGLDAGSGYRVDALPLLDQVVGRVRLPLLVLLAATGLLLTIACANVANLLLLRAVHRRRELSIRAALGAGRGRLVGRALGESLTLAGLAGVAGVGVALATLRVLHATAPGQLPRLREVGIDPGVLAFAAGASLIAALLSGTLPALRLSGVAPGDVLRETAVAAGGPGWRRGGSRYLVILQVALSVVLLAGASLLLRTFQSLRSVDPGFDPGAAISFRLSLVGDRYAEREQRVRAFEELHEMLRSNGAIEASGGASMLPLTRGFAWTDFVVEGHDDDDQRDRIVADVHTVTAGYFEALGVTMIAGRTFDREDAAEPLHVVVNRTFASRFWEPVDAVGRWVGNDFRARSTIVGVVEDVRHYGLDAEPRPTVYYPHPASGNRTLYTVVRIAGDHDPAAAAPLLTDAVRRLDDDLPVYDVRTMSGRLGDSLARQRTMMALLLLFAGTALVLATVGLYGVLAFAVAARSREIGIRRSVGARTVDLYGLVIRGAGAITLVGALLGVVAMLPAAPLIDGLLHGVGPRDPVSLLGAMVLVSLVAAGASLMPARRAARVDPMSVLRAE